LGAGEFEQLKVTAMHRVEVAGSDGYDHEVKGGSGWRLAVGKITKRLTASGVR
jgi:hypothetical protein